jgi:hypothetical protein
MPSNYTKTLGGHGTLVTKCAAPTLGLLLTVTGQLRIPGRCQSTGRDALRKYRLTGEVSLPVRFVRTSHQRPAHPRRTAGRGIGRHGPRAFLVLPGPRAVRSLLCTNVVRITLPARLILFTRGYRTVMRLGGVTPTAVAPA